MFLGGPATGCRSGGQFGGMSRVPLLRGYAVDGTVAPTPVVEVRAVARLSDAEYARTVFLPDELRRVGLAAVRLGEG